MPVSKRKIIGAFTKEIRELIRKKSKGEVIHLCSGSSRLGICVDLVEKADIKADVCYLPFRNGIADTVICDPPYEGATCHKKGMKKHEGGALYAASVSHRKQLLSEIKRITKLGGMLIFLHWYVPPLGWNWEEEEIYMVRYGAFRRIRALSFMSKVQSKLVINGS